MSFNLNLPTPAAFPAFPYDPPYNIQVDLMRHLYASIEEKKVTIVESPTGTGKTLSLLCAGLTWLEDEKNRARKGKLDAIANDGVEAKDWVIQQTLERARRELDEDEQRYEGKLAVARKRENIMRMKAKARVFKKPRQDPGPTNVLDDEDEDQFLPEGESQLADGEIYVSSELRALMEKLENPKKSANGDAEKELTCTKIYYASRTHSQLSQILPELRRLRFKPQLTFHHDILCSTKVKKRPARDVSVEDEAEDEQTTSTRMVSLGSRKQLCINERLRTRSRDLDEACRELLSEKSNKRCEFLPAMEDELVMLDLRDQILATPKDIEELAETGKLTHTCPYFASRRAIAQAELVALPYNLLLQKSAREALNIDVTDQIVIIDEAHTEQPDLISTLLSLYTTRLPYRTLAVSFEQVCTYVAKFRNRLGADNLLHLKRLVVFLDALKKYVLEWKISRKGKKGLEDMVEVITVTELLERLGRKASGLNLLEIEAYLHQSKVARKIAGYSDKEAEKSGNVKNVSRGAVPPLHIVEAFMLSLTGNADDGRITLSLLGAPGVEEVELKYQLLNPSLHFREVVDAARSVILAGGTISPVSDVINQLFPYLPPERLATFSCGHIIPPSNLQALVVSKGPRGGDLEYKAGKQSDIGVVAELGQILLNFTNVIPAGMVVFFPSYGFLNAAKAAWQANDLLEKLSVKKKTFFEPTESIEVEKILQEYSAAARVSTSHKTTKQRGALLFAVIGAKLSEGLNFADDLARAVVIVGLPFANLGSPELRERMQYVKRLEEKSGRKRLPGQKDAAAELYENMCLNAVNQSIGRAIRHQKDWASLILLDRRYASPSIRSKLAKWIEESITVTNGFGQTVSLLSTFYKSRRGSSDKMF